jgi:hypothetical protein
MCDRALKNAQKLKKIAYFLLPQQILPEKVYEKKNDALPVKH